LITKKLDLSSFSCIKRFFSRPILALEWLLFLYVVAGFVTSYLLPIPDVVKSILSLPSWLIIPYFFGSLFRIILRRLRIDSFGGVEAGVFSLLFGMYSLIIATFLLDLLGLSFILVNLYLVVLGFALVYLLHKTLRKVDDALLINRGFIKTYLPIFAFCILVSMIPAMMKTSVPSFPYGTIETISIPFEQTQPALRFMEYGYLQHPRVYDYVSLGVSSKLFNIDPLSFVWASSFLMMAIFSFGLYLFTYVISKNKGLSLWAVFVGSFLNMYIFRDAPLLFKANVFLYIFLPFILYLSYKNISKKEYSIKSVILSLLVFGLIAILYVYLHESNIWSTFVPQNIEYPLEWRSHVWLPTITVLTAPILLAVSYIPKIFGARNNFFADNAFLLTFVLFFFLAFQNTEAIAFILFTFGFIFFFFIAINKKISSLLYLFVASVFGFVLYQHFVAELPISNPISSLFLPSYSSSTEIISFSSRFNWLFEINLSFILAVLLVFGIVVCIFSKRKSDIFVVSVFAIALFLYLFPETFAYRFYREVTVIMAFVMAIGIWRITTALSGLRKKYSSFIFSALLIVLLLPSLLAPVYTRYYQASMGQSIVSEPEYAAAQWLKQNTPENTLLLSDFETIELLGTLSNKMLPIDRNYLVDGLNQESTQTLWHIKNMFSKNYANCTLENEQDPQFWKTYSFGKGSIDIQPANIIQPSINTTINIIDGNKSTAGLIHKFDTKQDWRNASGLYINWYGQNTNETWQICVAAADDSNWFAFSFVDNFEGWANVSASFNSFTNVGSPNWATISYIAIRTSNASPNNWTIGDVGLSYISSLNINSEEITYLKTHVTSTEQRYCQQTGLSLDNVSILIVLTSRTVQWVKQEGISQAITLLKDPVDNSYLKLFEKTSCLDEIYSLNNKIYVFKVK
jgi:hypothetical protein